MAISMLGWKSSKEYKELEDKLSSTTEEARQYQIHVDKLQSQIEHMTQGKSVAFDRDNLELELDLDKSSGKKLGIRTMDSGASRRVTFIDDAGLVGVWNAANPFKAVRPGDSIIEVNGISGDGESISAELNESKLLKVKIKGGSAKDILVSERNLFNENQDLLRSLAAVRKKSEEQAAKLTSNQLLLDSLAKRCTDLESRNQGQIEASGDGQSIETQLQRKPEYTKLPQAAAEEKVEIVWLQDELRRKDQELVSQSDRIKVLETQALIKESFTVEMDCMKQELNAANAQAASGEVARMAERTERDQAYQHVKEQLDKALTNSSINLIRIQEVEALQEDLKRAKECLQEFDARGLEVDFKTADIQERATLAEMSLEELKKQHAAVTSELVELKNRAPPGFQQDSDDKGEKDGSLHRMRERLAEAEAQARSEREKLVAQVEENRKLAAAEAATAEQRANECRVLKKQFDDAEAAATKDRNRILEELSLVKKALAKAGESQVHGQQRDTEELEVLRMEAATVREKLSRVEKEKVQALEQLEASTKDFAIEYDQLKSKVKTLVTAEEKTKNLEDIVNLRSQLEISSRENDDLRQRLREAETQCLDIGKSLEDLRAHAGANNELREKLAKAEQNAEDERRAVLKELSFLRQEAADCEAMRIKARRLEASIVEEREKLLIEMRNERKKHANELQELRSRLGVKNSETGSPASARSPLSRSQQNESQQESPTSQNSNPALARNRVSAETQKILDQVHARGLAKVDFEKQKFTMVGIPFEPVKYLPGMTDPGVNAVRFADPAHAQRVLSDLAALLNCISKARILIEGHTAGGSQVAGDSMARFAKALAFRRAELVMDTLIHRHGIARARIEAVGKPGLTGDNSYDCQIVTLSWGI